MHWRLNLTLRLSQGSASTYFRWSGQFRYTFVKGFFRDNPSNFYWKRFIFDRQGAKNKLAQFFLRHGVFWNSFCLPEYVSEKLYNPDRDFVENLLKPWTFYWVYYQYSRHSILSTKHHLATAVMFFFLDYSKYILLP